MSKDFIKAFSNLMDATFERYKGCLIEKSVNGYKWSDTIHPTLDASKEAIDAAYKGFGNNLKQTIK